MNYAYGVEFMELTNGNAKEIEATAGNTNTAGYHGNAVLSRWPVSDATIVRLHPLYDKLFVEKDKGMVSQLAFLVSLFLLIFTLTVAIMNIHKGRRRAKVGRTDGSLCYNTYC